MSHTSIIQTLIKYGLIDSDFDMNFKYMDDNEFLIDALYNSSLEQPMNNTTINVREINKLSSNVRMAVIAVSLRKMRLDLIDYIKTIDELIEYSEFYYYHSPCSPYRESMETIINREFSELVESIKG